MLIQGFYKLLALIDYIVYSLASTMISVNIDIAGKEIFRPEQIETLANRIYIVVGVLMLFKLVISGIQYMINPDAFDDKEKGLSGLLRKTVISIGLMVLAPAIFSFMITIQNTIIETIPKIVFGNEQQSNSQETGDKMTFTVLSSFIRPNEGKGGGVGEGQEIHDFTSFRVHAADGCDGGGFFGDASKCKYDYMILISTIGGGFLCYILMSMTLDVAIRTIKFSLIRILAPIPISSYVFSKDKLNKFVKTALTVYFDLFIRLAIIYLIIFAVQEIIKSDLLANIAGNDNWFRNVIVNVAIIGGLFYFARTAPKFISELLGLPDIGAGDMKDMFTRGAGLFGAGIGTGKRFIASRANARNEAMKDAGIDTNSDAWKNSNIFQKHKQIKAAMKNYNKKQGFGHGVNARALRSAGSALRTGAYQAYFKNKGYKDTVAAGEKAGQRSYDLDKALVDNNISRKQYYSELAKRRMGIESGLDIMNH